MTKQKPRTEKIGPGSRRGNAMARNLRKLKREGWSFEQCVDYAMRKGRSRAKSVLAARKAFRLATPDAVTAIYQGGAVNPR